ncbi:MAG: DNA-directed RNA polymerase subunit omega [Clostridia bacterium]|nr:DNA-directed RNA polymerase subunit omega [Clostridia bacterium]MBP5649414.1 DNA-directed RNA polymerase subunit omega [Clostridia bacterium]
MLLEPPIDKLVDKIGCKFALACLVSKRAREIQQRLGEEGMKDYDKNPVSEAAVEVYEDKIKIEE